MTPETTETIERFGWDGAVSLPTAIVLGMVLLGVFVWLCWLQRRAVTRGWMLALLTLRMTALGLLLWMLLGPSRITQERTTTSQSVAILVDASESMDVIDPAEAGNPLRWQWALFPEEAAQGASLGAIDRASVALRAAQGRFGHVGETLRQHLPTGTLRQQLDAVDTAIAHSQDHLEQLVEGLSAGDRDLAPQVSRLLQDLEQGIRGELRTAIDRISEGEVRSASDLAGTLDELPTDLDALERRLSSLSRELTERAVSQPQLPAAHSSETLSRGQQVLRVLAGTENADRDTSASEVRMKRWRFDDRVTPIAAGMTWEDGLRITAPAATTGIDGRRDDEPAATDISAALAQLGRDAAADSIRAALLISDGVHNVFDSSTPQEVAATLGGMPVHVVPIGSIEQRRDLEMYRVDAPSAVVKDDTILIDAIITAWDCAGEESAVTLVRDGIEVERRPLPLRDGQLDYRMSFQAAADEMGRHEFELSVNPLDGEAVTNNNSALFTVNVIQKELKLLLADRVARWEYRYLEQLFRRDGYLQFDRLQFDPKLSATGDLAATRALPRDVDGWDRYDVAILGDLEPSQFDIQTQEALDEYVRVRGGNLVVIAGSDHMPHGYRNQPLQELLPVVPGRTETSQDGYQIRLTPAGRSHPALLVAETPTESEQVWQQQYQAVPLFWLSAYSKPRPTAEVLIAAGHNVSGFEFNSTGDDRTGNALICWHRVGAGRVVYLSAPATYQLRFRRGDRFHHRFWGQMLRWLTAPELSSGTDRIRLTTDRVRYESGNPVEVVVRLTAENGEPIREAAVRAEARGPDDLSTDIELVADEQMPGRYFGTFAGLAPGAYRVQPTGAEVQKLLSSSGGEETPEALIIVTAQSGLEHRHTRCNLNLLQQIAEVTGGQVVPPTAIDEILALSAFAPEVRERVQQEPLWNHWSLFCLAFGCLSIEWIIRKRLGLTS